MSIYKKIYLDSSNGNIIVEKIADNGSLVVNTIDYNEFIAQHTKDLKERIEELQKLLERSEVCFDYKYREQAKEIEELKRQLADREKQLEEFIRQYQEKDLSLAGEKYREAFDLFIAGKVEEALLVLDEETLNEAEKTQAENRLLKGQILLSVNCMEEAEENYKKTVEICPSAKNYQSLGMFYRNIGCYKKAVTCFRKAKKYGNDDLNTLIQWNYIGSCHELMDDYSHASQYYQKAWKMAAKLGTLPYEDALNLICGMANVAWKMGDCQTAEEKYRSAIKAQRDALSWEENNFPYERLAKTLCSLAKILSSLENRAEEAEQLFLESIAIWEEHLQDNPDIYYPYYADTLLYYANFLANKDPIAAEEHYLKALKIFRNRVLNYRIIFKPVLSQILLSLSMLYSAMRRDADAVSLLKECVELMETLVSGKPDFYLYKLCYAYFQLGLLVKDDCERERYFIACLDSVNRMSIAQRTKSLKWEVQANYNLGILCCKEDFNKAFSYFDESIRVQRLQVAEEPGNEKEQQTLADILKEVGNFYFSIHKELGWEYLQESNRLYQSLGIRKEEYCNEELLDEELVDERYFDEEPCKQERINADDRLEAIDSPESPDLEVASILKANMLNEDR